MEMAVGESVTKQRRANPVLRVFAGIVSLPFIGAGAWATIADFPRGLLGGLALIVMGAAAISYAARGVQPRWFQG
jgi:hypothetical protein